MRSEAVRQEVLNRDGRRCQICGKDENLHVHHVLPTGMGGSVERDVAENMITLCAECHGMVHAGMLHIEQWIPLPDKSLPIDARGTSDEDILKGLVPQRAELCVTDGESRPLSNDKLWFYQRQQTEHLELVEARIQGLSAIEGDVAKDLWELSEGYFLLDPDAVSFAQYAAARGWSSNKAGMGARAFAWVEKHGLTWAVGLIAEKVDILRKASSKLEPNLLPAIWQELIDGAVDQSITDLKRVLIAKGYKSATMRWYLLIGEHKRPLGRVQTDTLFVRSRDYEIVMNRIGEGVKVVEVNAFKYNLKWDRKRQVLLDNEGRDVPFETWKKEA